MVLSLTPGTAQYIDPRVRQMLCLSRMLLCAAMIEHAVNTTAGLADDVSCSAAEAIACGCQFMYMCMCHICQEK